MQTVNQNQQTPVKQRKRRVVRSHDQWQALIKEYESGSMSQTAFCDKHQLASSSLHKWLKRFGEAVAESPFIAIDTATGTSQSADTDSSLADFPPWQVELDLGNNIVLRVRTL